MFAYDNLHTHSRNEREPAKYRAAFACGHCCPVFFELEGGEPQEMINLGKSTPEERQDAQLKTQGLETVTLNFWKFTELSSPFIRSSYKSLVS